jgi:hypothetical protein
VERTRGLLTQRQTPLVAQPSRRCTAAARDQPHVPLRGVGGGGTAIVSVEKYDVYIGRRIVPTLSGVPEILYPLCSMKKGLIPEWKQASGCPRPVCIARNAL